MAKRLTDKAIERLTTKGAPYIVWDATTTGLGIKITPRGRRIFVLQLRYPGHQVQTTRTLGTYPGQSLASARAKAERWRAWRNEGVDPAAAEAEEQARKEASRRAEALKEASTFASLAERYIAEHLATQRRAKAGAREIRGELIEAWGARTAGSITPADVRALVGKIKVRAPYQARNVFGHARTLFKWAVHQDLIGASPIASLEQRWVLAGAKIAPRQRVLDKTEIFAMWRAAGRLGYPYGPLYRLLLLTGCRLNELAKGSWSELHPDFRQTIREAQRTGTTVNWAAVPDSAKIWTIPAERFKSDVEHLVPLSDDACAILETLPRFAGCDILFTTTGETPVNGLSKSKQRLDAGIQRVLKGLARKRGDELSQVTLPGWVNHDLRRTLRTNLSALDVADHVAEMVLGHGRKGLQRVYDQHRYEPQMREALQRWEVRLRGIVDPTQAAPPRKNVIALRVAAG